MAVRAGEDGLELSLVVLLGLYVRLYQELPGLTVVLGLPALADASYCANELLGSATGPTNSAAAIGNPAAANKRLSIEIAS